MENQKKKTDLWGLRPDEENIPDDPTDYNVGQNDPFIIAIANITDWDEWDDD